MFLRKKTLDEVGLLDESFFMYGEDIDLSYRITLGGYDNYYFPEARILHYKGESTKKSSVNYVFVFYNAMAIFAQKHFTRKGPDLFAWLIRGAIYLSARFALNGKRTPDGQTLRTNDDVRRYLLKAAGFAVVPFQAFGVREDSGWFRLSVGAVSLQDIERVLPVLRAAISATS